VWDTTPAPPLGVATGGPKTQIYNRLRVRPTSTGTDRVDREPVITIDGVDLTVGSGRLVVSGVDLRVTRGEIVCVVGDSGSGKTTLLRAVAGLVKPSAGHITIAGEAVDAPRRAVAMVFQDYGKALLPWRTAAGNISLALEANRVPAGQRRQRIEALLATVGLLNQGDRFPHQLSGGMQQRLQLARCLAQDPKVLLMDEPFGALDAMTRQSLQDETLSIVDAAGATVLFVTHDLEEAVYLGDRVIGLFGRPGRIGIVLDVNLARPRDQLATREHPDFLRLRRELFDFIKNAESVTESRTARS
jgi:NitT/TauT family transport system ATP-binding protein